MEEICWVPVANYELDKRIVKDFLRNEKEITKEVVKVRFHELLEQEKIPYQNKLEEACNTKITRKPKLFNNHYLCVEIYVPEELEEKTIGILQKRQEEEDLWKRI